MKLWARVVLTALVVTVVAARFDLRPAVSAALSAAWAPFLFAVLCYVASQVVTALRWRRVARAAGFAITPAAAIHTYLAGAFFGLFVPTPIGGDAPRVLQLGRLAPGPSQAAIATTFDRLLGLVTLAVLAALAAWRVGDRVPETVIAAVATAAGLAMALWTTLPWLARFAPLPRSLHRLVAADVSRWFTGRFQAVLWTMSAGAHGLQVAAQLGLTRALGLRLDLPLVALCHGVVVVLGSLPLTVAGAGLREGAYVWVLSGAGVDVDRCVALGLLWFAVGVTNAVVGGLVFLAGSRAVPS